MVYLCYISHNNSNTRMKMETTSDNPRILYIKALVKVQAELPKAAQSGYVKLTDKNGYNYSTYEDLIDCSREILTRHGFSIEQDIISDENGSFLVETALSHEGGYVKTKRAQLHPENIHKPQAVGGWNTYIKKYAYAGSVGICAGFEDADDVEEAYTQRSDKAPSKTTSLPDVSGSYAATGDEKHPTQGQINFMVKVLEGNKEKEAEICRKFKVSSIVQVPKGMCTSILGFLGVKTSQQDKNYIPWDQIGVVSPTEQRLEKMMKQQAEYEDFDNQLPF